MSEPGQSEFSKSLVGGLVTPRNDKGLPFLPETSSLYRKTEQISAAHHRSNRLPESGMTIWQDEFGNLLTERGFKGVPEKDPSIQLDDDYPEGFRIYGLMVKDYLPRVIKASHFLRSHGLPTERVIEARKLERVPFEGKQITVEEWKEPALASFLQKTDSEELRKEKPNFLEKLKESLTNMEFVVVERDYPIGERLKDLRQIQTWKETPLTQKNAETFFRKVLRLHNLNADKESCEILAKKLDATKEEDWDYYLSIVLPVKMGRYLGRMHSLGLYHNFPTTHNWTVSGDLVDLDSVKGLPIFPTDSPIGEPEIKLDIDRTFSTLKDLGYLGHICTAKHFSYFIASYMNTYRKGQSWPQRWFPGPIEKLIYEKNLRFYAVALTEAKKLAQTLDV